MSEIVELLKEGESEKVEFKESVSQMDKIVESISAFSNTNEGTVVIGVRDKGEVLGVDIGKRTIENLANRIKQNTDPMVYPSIHDEEVDDKHVVVIEVEESKQKPVLAFGRAYKRVGKSNQKLGYEEIRKLALETSKVYWDERVCENASLEDIEEGFITNRSYQELNDVGKKTAYLELSGLVEKGLLSSTGKGRSVRYVARF